MHQNKMIAVIGARSCDKDIFQSAEEIGELLAKKGYNIICGGMGGVMEAVCKGAKTYSGITIGILPGDHTEEANPYVDIAIASGMGIGRNILIIHSALAVIAINGGFGTLSEIAFALQLGKPVVGLGTWDVSENIIQANDPSDAIEKLAILIPAL
jgi:uncharacterized protein (TIGR00725 family)